MFLHDEDNLEREPLRRVSPSTTKADYIIIVVVIAIIVGVIVAINITIIITVIVPNLISDGFRRWPWFSNDFVYAFRSVSITLFALVSLCHYIMNMSVGYL